MTDIITARKSALNTALSAIQTAKALFPQTEWGDEVTEIDEYLVEVLNDIQAKIEIVCIG